MIKYDRFWETLKKRHISQYYLINECGIEKRLLRRLRDNENVEIFSLDRICTVLNCDLDDIVEYVPNNPDIIEDAKTAQKETTDIHIHNSRIYPTDSLEYYTYFKEYRQKYDIGTEVEHKLSMEPEEVE